MLQQKKKKINLEKKNGQKRFIYALRSESGKLLSDPIDIRKRAACFYLGEDLLAVFNESLAKGRLLPKKRRPDGY